MSKAAFIMRGLKNAHVMHNLISSSLIKNPFMQAHLLKIIFWWFLVSNKSVVCLFDCEQLRCFQNLLMHFNCNKVSTESKIAEPDI